MPPLLCALLLGACGGGGAGDNLDSSSPTDSRTKNTEVTPTNTTTTEALNTNPAPVGSQIAGWRLVWSDEFTTNGLPASDRWDYDIEFNSTGWHNNELQYYARARLENSRVSNGQLIIQALQEDYAAPDSNRQRYTSARLLTRGKASWTYGFFEIRAKLPCAQGTWPAIWMLGTGGRWPEDGEIDIMEQKGQDKTQVLGTIHTRANNYFNGSVGVGLGNDKPLPNSCNAFNNYQLTWTPEKIEIAVNDEPPYFTYNNPYPNASAAFKKTTAYKDRWPFDQPHYLLLNIAMGGNLGGAINNAQLPAQMVVEYVRVYQR